eukprot:gene31268-37787_t
MQQGGFGIVRHSGAFGDAAVASSRAFAVRFLGKVHFGDFIRERAQSKWLGEDTGILTGRRRNLFEKATADDLFFFVTTSPMSLDDRLACLIDAAVGTILDVSDTLLVDPWNARQQVDFIMPPITMQAIPGTDVNDASIPIIERNPNHDDGEEDLYEDCTRLRSSPTTPISSHRRLLHTSMPMWTLHRLLSLASVLCQTRADILVKRRNPGSVVVLSKYIDVAITAPSAGLSDAANRFHDPGADIVVKRENKKRADYKRVAPHLEIVPFVMDCTGRAGQDAASFMAGVTGENKYLSRSVVAH